MEQLILIKTLEDLHKLKKYLADKEYVAFDTETTGLLKSSLIIGYSVSAEIDIGYYVVTRYWDVEKKELINLETLDESKEIMKMLATKKLIMQNSPFDCYMVKNNYDIELMGSLHTDTLILGHILNENRSNGLKELGVALFGETAKTEQKEMKESVIKNGGVLTKADYELYKADADLIGKYGAKDAILTLKIFFTLVTDLYDQKLDKFYYEDESMPLLRGPTYQMNTTGLRVDPKKLENLKGILEVDCAAAKDFIMREITSLVTKEYPGTIPKNTFNIGASKQLSWLLYNELEESFDILTKGGKELCKELGIKTPYSASEKRSFIIEVRSREGEVYLKPQYNWKTKKYGRAKKVAKWWHYVACGKGSLAKLSHKYEWVNKLLEYAKNLKILNTYVLGIQSRMQYGIIRPSFLQHGTTSGRYSSKSPNFQNLPKDDKRVKECIIAREGNVFVGADYSQLEPRVFASFSNDKRLLDCFKNGDDFYSVVGAEIFNKIGYSLKKNDENSFAKKFPQLRDIAKAVALACTYGTTAYKIAPSIKKTEQEAQEIINDYFEKFPNVKELMLESHKIAKMTGVVKNLFGRPRRIPKAKDIQKMFPNTDHADLDYEWRNLLNLSINHRIQSTGASIMNRAAIAFYDMCKVISEEDIKWDNVKIVCQVHDELIIECPEELGKKVADILKIAMEETVVLPGVDLIAEPKIGKNLAELK